MYKSDDGFTTVELVVVIIVIALLTAALFPAMASLISDARIAGAKQDAASIGAAIELLKIDGSFDPADHGLYDKVCELSGAQFHGQISELRSDGGFLYTVEAGNATYVVCYDATSGNVYEAENGDANTVIN